MARPIKSGVDYFPLDTVLDTKFELIEAEFGLTGFAVVVKLFQKIYGERGYYCEWTNEVALLFSHKCGGGNAVSEIVSAAIKRGIFDKDMYDKFQILTSRGIQERFFEAVNRRAHVEVKSEYLLVSADKISENVNINRVNVNINSKNVYNNSQIKGKEIKLNKSIYKGSQGSPDAPAKKHKYGEYNNVLLSDEEIDKLKKEFPKDYDMRIERLSAYMASTGKHYKNHLATIRNWARRDGAGNTSQSDEANSYSDLESITRRRSGMQNVEWKMENDGGKR